MIGSSRQSAHVSPASVSHAPISHARGRIGAALVLGMALACAPLAACGDSGAESGGGGGGTATATSTAPALATPATVEVRPGVAADVYTPTTTPSGPVPVVLLVPGGSWQTADRSGLAPLAEQLASAGSFVVNTTYRAGQDGATFPVPVQDVICAAGFAAAEAADQGLTPGPLVVVGHSAGGHLAALTALDDDTLAALPAEDDEAPCPYAVPEVSGLVGLAGIYDVIAAQSILADFFGGRQPSDDAALWQSGDPVELVAEAPDDLRVLLMHGDADDLVPLGQSQEFEAALEAQGVPVRLDVVPGADHADLYQADVVAAPVSEWIAGLAASASPSPAASGT